MNCHLTQPLAPRITRTPTPKIEESDVTVLNSQRLGRAGRGRGDREGRTERRMESPAVRRPRAEVSAQCSSSEKREWSTEV